MPRRSISSYACIPFRLLISKRPNYLELSLQYSYRVQMFLANSNTLSPTSKCFGIVVRLQYLRYSSYAFTKCSLAVLKSCIRFLRKSYTFRFNFLFFALLRKGSSYQIASRILLGMFSQTLDTSSQSDTFVLAYTLVLYANCAIYNSFA